MRTSETTLTEAVKAYVVSRTRFLDDTVFKFELLDFVSFLEAIARLVEMTPVPSKAALTELGVDQVSEFYERVAALKGRSTATTTGGDSRGCSPRTRTRPSRRSSSSCCPTCCRT